LETNPARRFAAVISQSERIAPQTVSGRSDIASDRALVDLLAARLRKSSYAPLRRVSGELRNGRIVLRGHVPSFYLKQLAQALAAQVCARGRLDNEIVVETLEWPPQVADRRMSEIPVMRAG
jgi:osmotically-inducible protein OsmY